MITKMMEEKKKTKEYAANIVREIKEECNKGVIKDHEIPTLVNWDTGEETGFAVILTLSTAYDYHNNVLDEWKTRLMAMDYVISVNRNRLQVKYNVMFERREDT